VLRLAALVLCCASLAVVPACSAGTQNGADTGPRPTDANVDGGHDAAHDANLPPEGGRPDAWSPPVDAGCTERLGPPYPIVFSHGFFGFEHFAGVDFIDYYFHVRADLESIGETHVYFPAVDPFNTSEVRATQLAAFIQHVLDTTCYARVNVIAHSQGGLDTRIVAHDHPDWIASVWTIATPHHGTRLSDVLDSLVADPNARSALDAVARLVYAPLYNADGSTSSVWLGIDQFNTPNIDAFNMAYPDAPGVTYFSIAGRSQSSDGGADCRVAGAPSFITRWDHDLDPVDPLLSIPALVVNAGMGIPNDGLVSVPSAMHGHFLGCIPADHLDEIGQLFGDSPGLLNDFDHLQFYRDLVAYLRSDGF
jgi:triacylglycerol lipase